MGTYYVTTPIYYVNDLPHIGHIFTTVVADAVARFQRLSGREVFFLTGTDEHGQNIERAAQREGVEPKELADRVVARYHELWKDLAISHDDFIRTTESRHKQGVHQLIQRIAQSGDLYVDRHEGWYCSSCESFYTEKELAPDKTCPLHGKRTEWHSEDNVFFRLSAYQQRLLGWYDDHPEFIRPQSRANEVRAFVAGGLRDLSVSRAGLAWGIPFPDHPGQTTYVWLDALTNYVSALGFGRDGEGATPYRRFWEGNGVRLHLVGKDILRFHAVYWPAFLMSAGVPLPTTVWAHGWWLRDQRKMSKSVGNIVRPDHLMDEFGSDSLRYFLLRDMVFGQDANFSDEAFIDRFNSDLANDLGNTVSRVVTLSRRTFESRTPPEACDDNPLIEVAAEVAREYRAAMEELAFQRALESLWRLLSEANQYLVEREPWHLVKKEGATSRVSRILWNGLEAARIVATGLLPVMPTTAARVLRAVGTERVPESLDALAWGGTPTDRELPAPEPLFPRIDKEAYLHTESAAEVASENTAKGKPSMITMQDFAQMELRVAEVTAAEAIPKSDKLLKLTVDLGDETRTAVAGIAQHYQPQDLVGTQVVLVANLEPAKLMGVESQGMILAVSVDGEPILLHPERAVPNGAPVR